MTRGARRTFGSRAHSGQALVETVIAVLIVTSIFLCLFKLSHALTGKILLEHAAMRAARARSVGFKEFMCWKVAQVSAIPVKGRRLCPAEGDEFDWNMELARVPIYLASPHEGVTAAVLRYERNVSWKGGFSGNSENMRVRLKTDWFDLDGEAGVEDNWRLYMNDEGR